MRLIDADKLILHLNDYALNESPRDNESTGEKRQSKVVYDAIQNCIKAVGEQPTAYDVDAVVEQLGDRSTLSRPVGWTKSYEIVTLDEALQIVRGGGTQ